VGRTRHGLPADINPEDRRFMSTSVSKQDIVSSVAEEAGIPRAQATKAVDAVFGAIQQALQQKQEVRVLGFGTFATATRKATTGRNPRTGASIDIPASTSVRFKPGKGLKDAVGASEDEE
jgi:DNA-binding protein HU-beta